MRTTRVLLASCAVVVAACGGDATERTTATGAASATATAFPLTFTNCGKQFTLTKAPTRVLLMEAAAPSLLFAAGAIDRVIARIEDFPKEYYAPEEMTVLSAIPALQAKATSTGGVEVSLEAIIDRKPDLVIGYDNETISHEALAKAGIQLYVMPPFCDNPPKPSFGSVVEEVRLYGRMFGTSATAEVSAAELDKAVAAVAGRAVAPGKKAAALYVTSDGKTLYAYSALGMVHPQIEALGMTNVFAELRERVPEISIEEVIARNPDVLILLYDDTGLTPEQITAFVTKRPGADRITAVAKGAVHPLLFNYSEPPTPLVIKGLGLLAEKITK